MRRLHWAGTWAGLGEGIHRRFDIAGAGRQTVTDRSGVLTTFDGRMDPELGFRIVRAYGLGWTQHQRGAVDATELFDGRVSVDRRVTLSS